MNNYAEEIFEIRNDIEADEMLAELREIRAEKARFEMIANARIENIKADLKTRIDNLDSKEQFTIAQLRAYTARVVMKETKTMRKYKLLSGELILKKPTTKLAHDDARILKYLQDHKDETYIKQQPKLDWAGMKEDLEIKGDAIINTATGELQEVDGLSIETVREVFDIKL